MWFVPAIFYLTKPIYPKIHISSPPTFSQNFFDNHKFYNYLDGFLFDENGKFIEEINDPDLQQIYFAEKLFGIDLNNDSVMGHNLQKLDKNSESQK